MNLWPIFITGLTTGGISCLAMQGGLLAGVIANQKQLEKRAKSKNFSNWRAFDKLDWLPVGLFLSAKLISHTLLGFLLGALGSVLTLSLNVRLTFQAFTAVFMLATAANLLNLHPVFRVLAFQPPRFLRQAIKKTGKNGSLFAPAALGFLTILVPCGVTQAMEVLAINSANPWQGALIMFTFVLGTSPVFSILGVATAKLSEAWSKNFSRLAAVFLIGLALYTLNGVLIVKGSGISLDVLKRQQQTNSPIAANRGFQEVTIGVYNQGYKPNYIKVKKNVPVKLTLTSQDTYSCALAFVFREFGINTFLKSTDTQSFTFTPKKAGRYRFSCSMGMYSGVLEVI